MATFLIAAGGIICAMGLASVIGGIPLLVPGFDPTMVLAGAVGAVGGILAIGLGAILKAVQQLGALPDRPATAEDAPVEAPPPAAPRPLPPHREVAQRDLPHSAEPAWDQNETTAESSHRGPAREPAHERAREPSYERARDPAYEPPPAPPPHRAAAAPAGPPPGMRPLAQPGAAPPASPARDRAPAAPPASEGAAPPRPAPFRAAWQKAWEQGWDGEAPAPPREAAAPNAAAHPPSDGPAGAHEVVKSGVIGGMRYTLYADGSIEAELAEGRVRFPSVQALRAHVERAEAARPAS